MSGTTVQLLTLKILHSILMLVFFLADSTFGRTATMRVIELGRERVKQEDYIKSGNFQSCNQHWRHCKELHV